MSMTHDQIIAVVQAHRDGKAIEFRMRDNPSNGWQEAKHLIGTNNFDFGAVDYRVKPEPREWWLSVNEIGHVCAAWDSYMAAESQSRNNRPIRVREVIE